MEKPTKKAKTLFWEKFLSTILVPTLAAAFVINPLSNAMPGIVGSAGNLLSSGVFRTAASSTTISLNLAMFGIALGAGVGLIISFWQRHRLIEKVVVKQSKKGVKLMAVAAPTVGLICLFVLFSYIALPHALRSSFDVDVKRICPFISDQQEEELESNWARMQSYDDYKSIADQISKYKDEFGL